MADKPLPSNLDAEKFVLGSLLMDQGLFHKAAGVLSPKDFSIEVHRVVYARMLELRDRNEHVDRITIANELMRFGELEKVGGITYLMSLDEGMPQIQNPESYIRIVRDKSMLRKIIFLARRMAQLAFDQQTNPMKILRQCGLAVSKLEVSSGEMPDMLNPYEIMESHDGGVTGFLSQSISLGISTGFQQLDDKILGLQPQGNYVLGGRTGSGKSALAMCIAMNVSRKGTPVAVFSLEMSREQWITRMVCAEAQIPLKLFITHQLDSQQRLAAQTAATEIKDLPLFIDDTPAVTIQDFMRRVSRVVAERKVRLVVLDYIQIMDFFGGDQKFKDETQAVSYASRACRLVARQHDLSTLVLSQFKRSEDRKKEAEPPRLSDFKQSGSIENDAYAAFAVHRPEQYAPGRPDLRGLAELHILKARMGEVGTVNLKFRGAWTRFYDEGGQTQG